MTELTSGMFENKPITIKPSLSIICNRRCGFCGIRRVDYEHVKKAKITSFMSLDYAEKMSKEIGSWLSNGVRFELGGFGEPLLNKNAIKIVGLIRKYNPKSQVLMYTNQSVLNKDKIKSLFDNGLNILFIDCYTTSGLEEAMELIFNNEYDNVFYGTSLFNPYRKGDVNRKIICLQDYTDTEGGGYNKKVKTLHNAAGNIDEFAYEKYNIARVTKSYNKMCVRPFRELVILPDGIVPICCQDWCRELIIGKFPEWSLEKIWNSQLMDLVKSRLKSSKRNFVPCNKCNHISKMVGLVSKPKNLNDHDNLEIEIACSNKLWISYKMKMLENEMHKGRLGAWYDYN